MKRTCQNCMLQQRFSEKSEVCKKCPYGRERITYMDRERKKVIKSQTSYRGAQQ